MSTTFQIDATPKWSALDAPPAGFKALYTALAILDLDPLGLQIAALSKAL